MQDKVIYVLEKLVRDPTVSELSKDAYLHRPVCYVQNEKKAQDLCRLAGRNKEGKSYVKYSKLVDLEYYKKLGFNLKEAK